MSSELFWIVNAVGKSSGTEANVALRGIQPGGYGLRKNYRLAEGREFTPGRFELIAGRGARNQFVGLEPGQTIRFGKTEWLVTGVFETGGSVFESELWCDVNVLQSAYQLGNGFQVVRARVDGAGGRERLEQALDGEQRLSVDVWSEKEFYSNQAEDTAALIRFIGIPVSVLMAIGAVFAALNAHVRLNRGPRARTGHLAGARLRFLSHGARHAAGIGDARFPGRGARLRHCLAGTQRLSSFHAGRQFQPGGVQFRGHARPPRAGHNGGADRGPGGRRLSGRPGGDRAGHRGPARAVAAGRPVWRGAQPVRALRLISRPAIAAAAAILVAAAAADGRDVIEYRKDVMLGMATHLSALTELLAGDIGFDERHVMAQATSLGLNAQLVSSLFPPGSDSDAGDTAALPGIWQRPEQFIARAEAAEREGRNLVAAAESGDTEFMVQSLKRLADACRACHREFRSEDP